jgi:hypothetical protein
MRSTVLCHVNSDFNDFIQTRTVHIWCNKWTLVDVINKKLFLRLKQ